MVRNPKMDSKSEFGYPRYGLKNRGSTQERQQAMRPLGPAVREAVGPTARGALCPREAHAPPHGLG